MTMGPKRWTFFLALILCCDPRPARASEEWITVRGRVVDASTGTPIPRAEVRVGQTRTLTDAEGVFHLRLSAHKPGAAGPSHWNLEVKAEGFQDHARRLDVGAEPTILEIALPPKARFRETVEVTAPEPAAEGPATLPVSPAQVLTVAGSLDNIFRVLQTLPGVTATDELGSRIAVRGGSPDQNLTIMDGVEIHNPYRLLGLTSAFNPETVERFELTAGGFGAKHGDRLSSLLVVENRDGNRTRTLGGSSSMSLTDGNLILEGKLPGRAKGSWLLTTRRTYYDLVAERLVHQDLPAFRDVQLKASWEPGTGRKLSLFALRSREDADTAFDGNASGERGSFVSDVHIDLLAATFQSRLGRGLSKTVASWYRDTSVYDGDARFRSDRHRSNTPGLDASPLTGIALGWRHLVRDFAAREELSLPIGSKHALEAGFEVHQIRSGILFTANLEQNPSAANGSSVRGGAGLPDLLDRASSHTRSGAWIETRLYLSNSFTLTPGVRMDWSGLSRDHPISPRLGGTLSLGKSTRLRAAVGLYTQSPGYEKLIQSDYLVDQADLDSERARHAILGLERDLAPGLTARVELYHKRFDKLIVGRLETEAERQDRLSRYDFPSELLGEIPREAIITSFPSNDATGTAYGVDVYVARTARGADTRLTGWASYTFGVAERAAYGRVYPFEYDRRHAVSCVANYRFGPRFSLSATGRASSGFPWTPFAGVRVAAFDDGSRLVPERDPDGRLVYYVAPGGLAVFNSERLPAFARLDLRLTFRPRGEKGRWQLYLEALNVLNRRNTAGIDATLRYDPVSDRPRLVGTRGGAIGLLPSFGVRFQFD